MSAQAEVASDQEQLIIAETSVKQAEDRLKGGAGRKIDQAQMRSNLSDTLALKETLEIGLRLANNRLCVLLGIPVHDLLPELGDGPIPVTPPEVVDCREQMPPRRNPAGGARSGLNDHFSQILSYVPSLTSEFSAASIAWCSA